MFPEASWENVPEPAVSGNIPQQDSCPRTSDLVIFADLCKAFCGDAEMDGKHVAEGKRGRVEEDRRGQSDRK